MHMRSNFVAILAAASLLTGAAHAQLNTKHKAAPPAAAPPAAAPQQQGDAAPTSNAPPKPTWAVRCGSASRSVPLECAIEQSAVLQQTGQLFLQINVRVPGDTHAPVVLIQLPLALGLSPAAGAKLQVDEGKTFDLPVQTCDNRGCYANTPVSADMLAALRSGKQLKISFQNAAKQLITIPMPLSDFAVAYDKIK